ncbi:hypothetical protein HY345_03015 [Candidatus Microgenomates bacterium]|nr:hypothetical protein [Candidatus Microgenomates bacterium]
MRVSYSLTGSLFQKGNLSVFVGLIVGIVSLPLLLTAVYQPQKLFSLAAPQTTLQIYPPQKQVDVNQQFNPAITISTGGLSVTAVEVTINFNPQYFSVVSVTPSGDFPVKLTNPEINNELGIVKFVFGVNPQNFKSGENLNVASLRLAIKNRTGQQHLTISQARVSALGQNGNVLKSTANMKINIGGNFLIGDINNSGKIDIFDLNLVLENLGFTNCNNLADLNGDCRVNIFDYSIVLENFNRAVTTVTPTPTNQNSSKGAVRNIKFNDPLLQYVGSWEMSDERDNYFAPRKIASEWKKPGSYVTLKFKGTKIKYNSFGMSQSAIAEINIDGDKYDFDQFIDNTSARNKVSIFWTSPVLNCTEHTFKATVSGRESKTKTSLWWYSYYGPEYRMSVQSFDITTCN